MWWWCPRKQVGPRASRPVTRRARLAALMGTAREANSRTRGPRHPTTRVEFSRPVHPGRVSGAHFEADPKP